MRRYFTVLILMVITTCILSGCNAQKSTKDYLEESQEKKPQIGMCFDSFVIERWQRDRDVFVSMAKELGAEVNIQNANGDVETQKQQIDYFIDKGMDVIVIISIDSEALTESVKRASDAGIKVIAYDRLINNADIDLYISFDNEKVGSLMADTLIQNGIRGGKVLMIGGSTTDNNVTLVEGAFRKKMQENNVTILDSMHCEGWKAERAADYMYENSDLVAEADAIMCGNDDVASRVILILSEKRLAGRILVTGQDADLSACQRIVEGTQVMTVYKPVEKLAGRAAECAVALARGQEIDDEDVVSIKNGDYQVSYIGLAPVCVTKQNIDETIINSGFHQREDVYLNVDK